MNEQPTEPIIISADGKCVSPVISSHDPDQLDHLDDLEIIIDGTQMLGGSDTASMIGKSPEFFKESRAYKLVEMRPLENGRCLARYIRT